MHKQCSQIGVTALAQPQLPNSTTFAYLSRNQSHPSRKLPTGAKGFDGEETYVSGDAGYTSVKKGP
jgi:hypothetical protein